MEQLSPRLEDGPAGKVPGAEHDMTVHFTQYFHGDIVAEGAHFGVGRGSAARGGTSAVAPRTGPLDASDIDAALTRYVRPAAYANAFEALALERVVILSGRRGVGKRTGAIALLREVTSELLSVLSPTTALAELSRYEFRSGHGYLIADYSEVSEAGDIEFDWRTVRARVRECDAWLLVTTSTGTRHGESATGIDWSRPDTAEFVAAWLADAAAGAAPILPAAETIVDALPPECAPADMTAVMTRICAGESITDAVRVLDDSVRAEVRRWFDDNGPRTRAQVLEVAALAFLGPSGRRYFESRLAQLIAAVNTTVPVPDRAPAPPEQADNHLPEQRSATTGGDSLITVSRSVSSQLPGQTLVFRVPAFRRTVIDELWARLDVAFWDGLTSWLRQVAASTDPDEAARHSELAVGVSALALVDFDEVQQTLLEPWSRGVDGWAGQLASLHATWLMCHTELLAPVALRTVVTWAIQGSPEQRHTAAHAFSGMLGVLYPEESTTRLWHLIVQARADDFTPTFAMASLFASLVASSTAGSEIVLTRLLAEYDRATNHRSRSYAARVLGQVLSVRDHRTGRSATFTAVHNAPEQIELHVRAWAAALGYGPIRGAVLDALLGGLYDLPALSDSAEQPAATFGRVFTQLSTDREITAFVHDLAVRLKRRQDRRRTGHPTGSGHREADLDRLVRVVIDATGSTQLDRKKTS